MEKRSKVQQGQSKGRQTRDGKKPQVTNIAFKTDFVQEAKFEGYTPRTLFDPNKEKLIESYKRISDMWNKDNGSRNFLKHLIGAFIPVIHMNRIFEAGDEKLSCCILGEPLTGIKEISQKMGKVSTQKLFIDCQVLADDRKTYSKEDQQKLKQLKDEAGKEATEARTCYMSNDSTKYLSKEAIMALEVFVENMLGLNNKTIHSMISKKRKKLDYENREANKSDEQKRLGKQRKIDAEKAQEAKLLENNVSGSSLDALMKLKEQLV